MAKLTRIIDDRVTTKIQLFGFLLYCGVLISLEIKGLKIHFSPPFERGYTIVRLPIYITVTPFFSLV